MITSQKNFSLYSDYYDLFYADKDYKAEADYIFSIIETHGAEVNSILEFGCGTGGHAVFLCERGLVVDGVEISSEMISRAKQHENFSIHQGDVCSADMGKRYDLVMSIFHVASYQTASEKISSMFRNAARHLNSGGLFIFDYWFSGAVLTQRPVVRVKRCDNERIKAVRIAEPSEDIAHSKVTVDYTILIEDTISGLTSQFFESHPMRHFSLYEIELLARSSGFEIIQTEELVTKRVPSTDTWALCTVCRRT